MSSKNRKNFDPYRLVLELTEEISFKVSDKNIALPNISIYSSWRNVNIFSKREKLKKSPPTWIDEFELPNVSYSIDTQY